jgi:hypothetical protein
VIPAITFETIYQHLWNNVTQSGQTNAIITRQGNSWNNRFNMSRRLSSKFHPHLSIDATYVENLYFRNNDSLNLKEKFYPSSFTPDFNLSINYRWKPWISLNVTASYGTTFVYLDSIPHKQQISYGFRIAPFYNAKRGIFRTFRAEFVGYYIYLPDINESIESVLPIFPYFYWQ